MRRSIGQIIIICHYLISKVLSYYEEPSYTKYPFIISIQASGPGHICSGSLVGLKWVLTCAHCVADYEKTPDKLNVVAGAPNSPEEQMRLVEKVYVHNKFDKVSDYDDIALLFLDEKFLRSETVDTIHIPKYTLHIEIKTYCKTVEVIGFEMQEVLERRIAKAVVRPALMAYNHSVLSEEECAKKRKFKVMKHTFCGYAENMTACMLDSGGPAICEGLVYGLTFYGCPWDQSPSYFTRVDRYLIFIEAIMGRDAPYLSAKRSSADKLRLEVCSISLITLIFYLVTIS